MLAAITSMLNQCTSPDMAVPAAVALHGLKELCCAEVTHTHINTHIFMCILALTLFVLQVVDILSTWKSLGLQLRTDSRTPLVKATAEILALVPQLTVKTEEYEVAPLLSRAFIQCFHIPSVFWGLFLLIAS